MSDGLKINARLTIPDSCLEWSTTRSGGAGGQNVNKVSTKVDLRFDLQNCGVLTASQRERLSRKLGNRLDARGRVLIVSEKTRHRVRNLEDARERLAELIRVALLVPKARKATKPSRGAKRRRLSDKKKQSEKKATRGSVTRDD